MLNSSTKLLNSVSENQDQKYINTKNIEVLIDLKFAIEREFSVLDDTFKKTKERRYKTMEEDIDINKIFRLYENNIEKYGNIFLKKQTELLQQVDDILLQKCKHIWIDDVIDGPFSSRNICYCNKCFIRK